MLEFEQNLAALGYGGFSVDDEFSSYTAAAVKLWQQSLGEATTGRVDFGRVVFLPGPIRVVSDMGDLGLEASGSTVLQTATRLVVSVNSKDGDLGWASIGARATITLPSQHTMTANVTRVATNARGETVARLAPRARHGASGLARLKPGAVTVNYIARKVSHALTVPVTSLVALAEGGYGVQLADQSRSYVPVRTGLYADGFVAVRGHLHPGERIRVPQ